MRRDELLIAIRISIVAEVLWTTLAVCLGVFVDPDAFNMLGGCIGIALVVPLFWAIDKLLD